MRKMFIPYGCHEALKDRVDRMAGKNPRFLFPKYVYVLSRLIYHHTYMPDRYESEGVAFNMKTLAKVLGATDGDTKRIIDDLRQWDYIILYKEYRAGVRSRSYKLHPQYEHGQYSMLRFDRTHGKLISKLIVEAGKNMADQLGEQQLSILRDRVTVSREGLDFIISKYSNGYVDAIIDMYGTDDLGNLDNDVLAQIPIEARDLVFFSILLKDFFVVRLDKASRIYTNITSLKGNTAAFY